MKSIFSAISKRRNPAIVSLGLTVLLAFGALSRAAIPPAERILPNDTLFVMSAPDFNQLREIKKHSPQSEFWNDPAMKPFKDKFMAKLKEEVVTPLERELGVHLNDYTSLPSRQLTLAVTGNGSAPMSSGVGCQGTFRRT